MASPHSLGVFGLKLLRRLRAHVVLGLSWLVGVGQHCTGGLNEGGELGSSFVDAYTSVLQRWQMNADASTKHSTRLKRSRETTRGLLHHCFFKLDSLCVDLIHRLMHFLTATCNPRLPIGWSWWPCTNGQWIPCGPSSAHVSVLSPSTPTPANEKNIIYIYIYMLPPPPLTYLCWGSKEHPIAMSHDLKQKERLELKNCGDRYGGTAKRVRRLDRTVSESSGSISSLSNCHLTFLVL